MYQNEIATQFRLPDTGRSSGNCNVCHQPSSWIIEKGRDYHLYQCKNCNLVFGRSFSETPDYNSEYEETGLYSGKYQKALKAVTGSNVRLPYGPGIFFLKYRNRRNKRLLDLGCGAGTFMLQAKKRGFSVFGIDISDRAVSFIRDKLELGAISCSIENLTGVLPQFKSGFDYVTAFEVIEHVSSPNDFLVEAKNLLKDQGHIILSTPNWNSHYYRKSRGPMNRPPIHVTFWTPETIAAALSKLGFKHIRIFEKPFAMGEFNEARSKIHKACHIARSIIFDGIFKRTVGITMVVTAQN